MGEQIELPDRCDLQRLHDRVKKMPLKKNEVIDAFTALYLGNQKEEFGEFIRKGFTDEELKLFWNEQFIFSKIGTYGFSNWLKKYLLWGFQVADLKEYVLFEDEEGNSLAERFVKAVLDTEVFLEETWDKIIHDIEESIDTFERYYPMVRVEPTRNEQIHFIRALVLNDELYQYCVGHFSNTCATTVKDVTRRTSQ